MVIKPVTGYQTTDGKFFVDLEKAQSHQRELDFEAWYVVDNHGLYSAQQGGVAPTEVKEWLHTYRAQVLNLFGVADSMDAYSKAAHELWNLQPSNAVPRQTGMPAELAAPYGTDKGAN